MEEKQVRENSSTEIKSEAIPDWLAGTMNSFSDNSNTSGTLEKKEEENNNVEMF
jgi:hypothetical protein